jgi:hypothetical protein
MRITVPPNKFLLHEPLKVLLDTRHQLVVVDVVVPPVNVLQVTALGAAQYDALIAMTADSAPPLARDEIVDIPRGMPESVRVPEPAECAAGLVIWRGRDGARGPAYRVDQAVEFGQEGRGECVGGDYDRGRLDIAARGMYDPTFPWAL